MLSIDRDLPASERRPKAARARGIADLIVLLNPAFEGSRYDAVFEASQHYQPVDKEPPLVVMLTSTADLATKNAFPIARWVNSAFQYPSSSDDQSTAMRRTPGHIERFLTHKLCLGEQECAALPGDDAPADAESGLPWGTSRRYCGGLVLREYRSPSLPFRPIVWNVRTHSAVIPNHNDIDGPQVIRFISQVYGDVTGLSSSACDDEDAAAAPLAENAAPGEMQVVEGKPAP